ncbi:hypothetical protein HW132_12920 [Brasilonema sp. CT11]|nr:hypothetical protein [Brasilonema sp. CT11]
MYASVTQGEDASGIRTTPLVQIWAIRQGRLPFGQSHVISPSIYIALMGLITWLKHSDVLLLVLAHFWAYLE